MSEVLTMPDVITPQEAAKRIRRERRVQEISLRELGERFDVPHQTVSLAENPEKGGDKINALRARILGFLLKKPVSGPVFVIDDTPSFL